MQIGPWQEREFAVALQGIDSADSWQSASNIDAASKLLRETLSPPELLLLAQLLPGEYAHADLLKLQELAPLARIVVVAGTWCEGEMRTGNPPPGVLRLYWHEVAPWWQAASRQLTVGRCPAWSLPMDNPQAGRYLPETYQQSHASKGQVAIATIDFSTYETLAGTLLGVGIESIWTRQSDLSCLPKRVSAGIWEGGQLDPDERRKPDNVLSACWRRESAGDCTAGFSASRTRGASAPCRPDCSVW